MEIRPVSDLRNKFTEVSKIVHDTNKPIFFTKNGYGDMVVMSVELYEQLSSGVAGEEELDVSDLQSKADSEEKSSAQDDFELDINKVQAYTAIDDTPDVQEEPEEQHTARRGGFFSRFGRNDD